MERMIVQHLHTDKSGRKPLPENIMYGELAINYAANDETLFIKNSESAITEFKDDKYYQKQLSEKTDKTLSLTYSELVSLRDNSQLIPGQQYRITDYQCTTTQENTRSAGHPFDIIVTADDESTLNEEARAILHTGDTYFANSDLSAWKIWYSLDNDTTRFAWADATNGKGVIYRMIDEFGNDCPYDFKNIQFKRYAVTDVTSTKLTSDALNNLKNTFVYKENEHPIHFSFSSSNITNNGSTLVIDNNNYGWYYTFSTIKYDNGYPSVIEDASVIGVNFYDDKGGGGCFNNKIEVYRDFMASDNGGLDGCCVLNNIVFNGRYEQDGYVYNAYSNHIKSQSYSNTFGNNCGCNTFETNCFNNTFGNSCCNNTFENHCDGNTFGNYCHMNTFGNHCYYNTFGNNCHMNTFGNHCDGNTFGNYCHDNTFGNNFGYYGNNTFGDNCQHNTFGNYCARNTFGNGCNSNTFGNYFVENTFGNHCYYNTFGNHCSGNRFGNNCGCNTFGNGCYHIRFVTGSYAKSDYYQYNHFGDGCQNIVFKGEETASSSAQVQNYNFAQGLQGTDSSYLTINGVRNRSFETKVEKNSNGDLKIFCLADLIIFEEETPEPSQPSYPYSTNFIGDI